ncbi:phospholipase-like protein [Tanacetum coccineum]
MISFSLQESKNENGRIVEREKKELWIETNVYTYKLTTNPSPCVEKGYLYPNKASHIEAMNKEIQALEANHTWDITTLPPGKLPIDQNRIINITIPQGCLKKLPPNLVCHTEEVHFIGPNKLTYHCNDTATIKLIKQQLNLTFSIKDLQSLHYYLGVEILQNSTGLVMSQRKYALDLLQSVGLLNHKPSTIPMNPIKTLNATDGIPLTDLLLTPDLSFAAQALSQFSHQPRTTHLAALYKVIRYLKLCPGQGLYFPKGNMMSEVDIENLTIKQYLMLTQENEAQGMVKNEYGGMMKKDIEDITIAEYIEYEEEMKRKPWKNARFYYPTNRDNQIMSIAMNRGVSIVAEDAEWDISRALPSQLPPKELNPGSFTLPCTIASLKETSMVVEMADMTKKDPLGIVENILVKIDKFLFPSDFVIIDMPGEPNETVILGRPFLATIHAQIDVFKEEISLRIGEDRIRFDMDRGVSHPKIHVEKIYMASSVHEEEYFNPLEIKNDVFSYESPTCLLFEQHTQSCDNGSIDTLGLAQELKECGKDWGMWPTYNLDLSFCGGYDAIYGKGENGMLKQWMCFRDHKRQSVGANRMVFTNFLKVRYGNKVIDDTTRERR